MIKNISNAIDNPYEASASLYTFYLELGDFLNLISGLSFDDGDDALFVSPHFY